jgi:hypothetical protein
MVATLMATLLAACTGDGTTAAAPTPAPAPAPTPPPPPSSGPTLLERTNAATATAQSNAMCTAIGPFYWEVGDKTGKLASGSIGTDYNESSVITIASASKWLYAAYVAEKRSGVLTADDIKLLNFRSGHTYFSSITGCQTDNVAGCLNDPGLSLGQPINNPTNGDYNPAYDGVFYYGGGHMQVHAATLMTGLAAMDSAALGHELSTVLGVGTSSADFYYNQPQMAGGVFTSPSQYGVFLRKILNKTLKISGLLSANLVPTNNVLYPTQAQYTPIPTSVSWQYSIGHWVEADPNANASVTTGDGSFSSPGAFGFYPWIDATQTYYGMVARVVQGGYFESTQCGAVVRKAWVTGTAQ